MRVLSYILRKMRNNRDFLNRGVIGHDSRVSTATLAAEWRRDFRGQKER